MQNEQEKPRVLDAEEIKTGIAQIVADAVYERLGPGVLYGRAFPKFKGTVSIHLELEDFGQTIIDNSITKVDAGEVGTGSVPLDVELEINQVPPNVFRSDTDQPIIKSVLEGDKTVERKVRYQPRSKAQKAASKTVSKKGA